MKQAIGVWGCPVSTAMFRGGGSSPAIEPRQVTYNGAIVKHFIPRAIPAPVNDNIGQAA
jgi:hypothetical protein